MTVSGTVVAAYGRQYRVELTDGATVLCVPRGKKSEFVCGDGVTIDRLDSQQGVIQALAPRQSLLYRSDPGREKLIAANVTQIVIVVATEPPFSDELITRCIVAAESQGIAVLIVLNKCDLEDRLTAATMQRVISSSENGGSVATTMTICVTLAAMSFSRPGSER
ncbi:MAG: GTPase RsgA [Elusimicrobia bacterium]|nr:MAG: GTPase RsgA [Elusimicrobiota bacterium]